MKNNKRKTIALVSLLALTGCAIGVGSMTNPSLLGNNLVATEDCSLTFDVLGKTVFGENYIQKSAVRLSTSGFTKNRKTMSLAANGEIKTSGVEYSGAQGWGSILNEITSVTLDVVEGSFKLYTAYTDMANFELVYTSEGVGNQTFNTNSVYMRSPRYMKIVAGDAGLEFKQLNINCVGTPVTDFGQLKDGKYSALLHATDSVNGLDYTNEAYTFDVVNGVIAMPSFDTSDLIIEEPINFYPAFAGDQTDLDLKDDCNYLLNLDKAYSKNYELNPYFFSYDGTSKSISAFIKDEGYNTTYECTITGIKKIVTATKLEVKETLNETAALDSYELNVGDTVPLTAIATGLNDEAASSDIIWTLADAESQYLKFVDAKNKAVGEKVVVKALAGTTEPIKLSIQCDDIVKTISFTVKAQEVSALDERMVGTFTFTATIYDGTYLNVTINADGSGKAEEYMWGSDLAGEATWTADDVTITENGTILSIKTKTAEMQFTLDGGAGRPSISGDAFTLPYSQCDSSFYLGVLADA